MTIECILIGGAGGAPSINYTRSLRRSGRDYRLVGLDCDPYNLLKAETDERHLVPRADSPDYVAIVHGLVRETGARFLHVQNDHEVAVVSARRTEFGVPTYLPAPRTVEVCQDKVLSYEAWRRAGLRVPKTFLIADEADLRAAFREIGGRVWLRATSGAFGLGSLPTDDLPFAKAWIDLHRGWGRFSAAECLTADTVTWQSIWHEGELVVAQGRKRLYWEFGNRTLSGVTGLTGAGVTVSDPSVDQVAEAAIRAIDPRPHGIFGVDLTYDRAHAANPTEINIGRFFTTHLFFTEAGLNLPQIYTRIGLGEAPPSIDKRRNPLPEGLVWIRGMDSEPVLSDLATVHGYERGLAERRSRLVPGGGGEAG